MGEPFISGNETVSTRATPTQPLTGYRVIECAQLIAGPFCGMLLADMGADVIKIEQPGMGDLSRNMYSAKLGGEGVLFLCSNRNKRSVTLDLASPEGREIFRRLVATSDVFIEGFRGGVAERLGIGYEELRPINPQIIYCSISGFGPAGPHREKPAMDAVLQAWGGIMAITGEPGGGPLLCGTAIADITGSLLAGQGILLALLHRERTGTGQRVDAALLDGMVYAITPRISVFFATGENLTPQGSAHPEVVPYQAFEAKDGWLFMSVWSDKTWPAFCDAIGRPSLGTDPRFGSAIGRREHRGELVSVLKEAFLQRTVKEWMSLLERADVLCAPVNRFSDLMEDAQVRANQMIVEQEHPTAGRIPITGIPIKLSATPGTIRTPAPLLGQHTREVLSGIGYSEEELSSFAEKGVI